MMAHISNEKVVFVTGAASGLGKATTQRFLRDGYKTVPTMIIGDTVVVDWDRRALEKALVGEGLLSG